jgi:predicted transcriptional regulator
MSIIKVELSLSDKLLNRLKDEAQRSNMPLDEVVKAAIEDYLADDEDKAEILDSFREGFREAMQGDLRPAREVLAELRKERASNGD